jgi:hypothetical protein
VKIVGKTCIGLLFVILISQIVNHDIYKVSIVLFYAHFVIMEMEFDDIGHVDIFGDAQMFIYKQKWSWM